MKHAWLLALWVLACAPSLPPAYVRSRDAATQAYSRGQFTAAGQHWLDAARAAGSARDRTESRYRAATSYERAGELTRATELYTQLASGNSERAARASFALADLRLRAGDVTRGNAQLEAAIRKYPSSGVASLALRRYFSVLAEQGGDQAVLDYIRRVEPELQNSELEGQLRYERARRLEAQGSIAEARDAYLVLAERFPYPHGAYWDDALFRGADCELKLGQPERAITLLQRMLRARETAHLSGSYERPRFAEAAFRLAELYRDARHDRDAARRAFHGVFVEYPTSTLQDDALWQEALLSRHTNQRAACAPLELLVQRLPDSRYAPCAHELCRELPKLATRECAAYIERQLREQNSEPKPESAN